jgi:serine/threonine protein phosphatase PrpC
VDLSVLPEGITVYVYARTDVGMKRQGNEDSFLVADLSSGRLGLGPEVVEHQLGSQGSLMIVSDGLGGAAAGEVASAMAVQTVCTELMKSTKSVLSPSDRLKRATEQANEQIWACAQSDNSLRGMGATLTAAFVYGSSVYIAQVGDSRAYIVRGGRVKQVTEDQSWANAVKKAGLEIADVPNNVILQALGTQPKVHVEVTSVDLLNNDVLLMCSDGLSNKIKDLEMREIASSGKDLAENCRHLIELANKRGGEDNITVILARFVGKSLSLGLERDLSITSTFKVVAPLDFGESLDDNETMSFQAEGPDLNQSVDPMAMTQSALLDGIPTVADLPKVPVVSNVVGNLPTTPLTSPSSKDENKTATTPLLAKEDNQRTGKKLSSPEKTAFRQADTKTDLPAVPVFDLSKEPPTIETKVKSEPEVKIEFIPTPINEPKISTSPVLENPSKNARPDVVAIPPKPVENKIPPSIASPKLAPPKLEMPVLNVPSAGNVSKPVDAVPLPIKAPQNPIVPPNLVTSPNKVGSDIKAPSVPTTKPSAPVAPIFAPPPLKAPVPAIPGSAPVTKPMPPIVPTSAIIPPPGLTPSLGGNSNSSVSDDLQKKPDIVPSALSANLFAPPPPKTSVVAPSLSPPSDKPAMVKPMPPPATLPTAPLNLFGGDNTSPLAPLPEAPKPTVPKPLAPGGLFAPPPKASSPNAPKVDDFLENSLFTPVDQPPAQLKGALPPLSKGQVVKQPGANFLENSLFSPPPKPGISSESGANPTGLIFAESFKEKASIPTPKKLDDEPEPVMLETLSVAAPVEENKVPTNNSLFAPPAVVPPQNPFAPPATTKPDIKAPLSAPLFAPPIAKAPVPTNTLPNPVAKTEVPTDAKNNKTGVEVLASLFSAPTPNKPVPTSNTSANIPPPPLVKNDIAKVDIGAKEPIKPAPPALVLPPSPKKADLAPLVPPSPLKPAMPPIAPPPKAVPPAPNMAPPIAPPPLGAAKEEKNVKWATKEDLTPIAPNKKEEPSDPKKPLFTPPPVQNKPVNLPPPPTSSVGAKPPIAGLSAPPPAKLDLPPAPKPAPSLPPAPSPAKADTPFPPPSSGSAKADSFDEFKTNPPVNTERNFSEVTSGATKKASQLNPKLIIALGTVIVVIVGVVIGIFMLSGKNTQVATNDPAKNTPITNPSPIETPVQQTPVATPSPVATASTKPVASPTPVQPDVVLPKDTPGLVKYALEEVSKTIDRVQKEFPDSNPAKEPQLKVLKTYKDRLAEYSAKNVATEEARSDSEIAINKVKSIKTQLDALPKPTAGRKR